MKSYFELNLKRCLTICVFILTSILSQAQNDHLNHQKYWFYRWRLLKSFMVVGDCDGCSIPANQRRHYAYQNGEIDNLKFGDGTIILGQYISMLATEFKLLTINNQSTLQTRKELYYALKAFNRLDIKAEDCMNMNCLGSTIPLNGYFMREDIPADFLLQHPELMPANETSPLSVGHLMTDYTADAGNGSQCVEMSIDQIVGMLTGLKLCSMYIPSSTFYRGDNDNLTPFQFQDNVMDILEEVKAITRRIVTYAKSCNWILQRPCGGHVNGGHGGAWSVNYASPINQIAYDITGDFEFSQANPINAIINQCSWNLAAEYAILSPGGTNWITNGMTYQLMATGGQIVPLLPPNCPILSDDRNILANQSSGGQAGKYTFEWMPLMHSIIENYNLTNNLWPNTYADYINSAPCNGPYCFKQGSSNCGGGNQEVCDAYPYPNKNLPNFNWTSSNLLNSPGRRCYNEDLENGDFAANIPEGEYNGIDYLLLYNLYRLNQIRQDNNNSVGFSNMINNSISLTMPYTIGSLINITIGNHAKPQKIELFESIQSTGKILADGDITYRAGKEIALKPGFEVHSTADFHGYIQPLICNTNDNYYHRSVSAEVVSGKMDLSGVKVDLFPNPANTNFTVRSTEIMQEVIIYDLNGKQVLHKKDIESSIVEIDTTLLVKGLYVVEVVNKLSSNRFRVKLSLN